MSGDWIPVSLPDRIRARFSGAEVISLGGATEGSIWSIFYPIGEVDTAWESIPYGRPLLNQTFHVLNEGMEPCPVWVPGQLYIGGAGVAEGYWRDEERTQASFLRAPRTGERLYRTGDLGRYLPDGNLEFLGREDLQVKISGHRIELGEIEAVLLQHAGVRAAVVAVAGEQRANRQLVAYLLPAERLTAEPAQNDWSSLTERALLPENGGPSWSLPEPADADGQAELYRQRASYRHFRAEPIALARLGQVLSCLREVEVDGRPRRRYGSAGGLYPVQTFVWVRPERVEGLPGGFFYYHPRNHSLLLLSAGAVIDGGVHFPGNRPMFDESAFSVFLVGQLDAISPKYGEKSRDFCLLEAGLICQLLETWGPACDLGFCQVGKLLDEETVAAQIGLGESQLLVHSLVGGWREIRRPTAVPWNSDALIGEVQELARQKLPAYMVPASFMLLETLPLSTNGKVDRSALPQPRELTQARTGHVPPATELERTVAAVLQELLDTPEIGVHDSFFDLGADSVSVVKAYGVLCGRLAISFPLLAMFEHPTVHRLAKYLSQRETEPGPTYDKNRQRARLQQTGMSQQAQRMKQRRRPQV